MEISLDLESVLAETNEPVLRTTDRLTRAQVEETWFSRSEDQLGYQIYMGVSDAIWRHSPESIPPEEPNLAEYVDGLRENHTVDIVTHREHVDEQAIWWLEEHGIEYDDFVPCNVPKDELDYDVYIDDSPTFFERFRSIPSGDTHFFLRHQPWNTDCNAEISPYSWRIHSLAEVSDHL